ncbi:MAG: DNA topoisomerase IB [Acidobacteria bacterium]|nr:DNA topoisomerase IB [Acidobacteriota bacterium]
MPFPADPPASADVAGLRYVVLSRRGIARLRSGKGFRYIGPDGRAVTDAITLARIRSLAIPPAWREVWICPSAEGHLQAVGRDARGRKQYRYHPLYRHVRDQTKFGRMLAFGAALPKIRERVEADLRRPGLPREKVLAAVVRLLDETGIRIGGDEYEKANGSYGLTTLKDQHATVSGDVVRFKFRGKSGKEQMIELSDRRLAKIVRKCRYLPGYDLFQYLDADGNVCDVTSAEVNEYVRAIAGEDFTAKDFRTWCGTGVAALVFEEIGTAETQRERKHNVAEVVKRVAESLGNRPATCKKYYVHPAVIEAYEDGTLFETLSSCNSSASTGLRREEECVLKLVAKYVEKLKLPKKPGEDYIDELRQSLSASPGRTVADTSSGSANGSGVNNAGASVRFTARPSALALRTGTRTPK